MLEPQTVDFCKPARAVEAFASHRTAATQDAMQKSSTHGVHILGLECTPTVAIAYVCVCTYVNNMSLCVCVCMLYVCMSVYIYVRMYLCE